MITTVGIIYGNISFKILGNKGFGYDSIFIPNGSKLTFGQISAKKKMKIDHRNIAFKRLKIMESTSDGFVISDEDLKLRGPGDFFGTKQHGFIKSKIINFSQDYEIINRSRKKAFEIIDEDSKLSLSKNSLIKLEFLKNYKEMLEFINIG